MKVYIPVAGYHYEGYEYGGVHTSLENALAQVKEDCGDRRREKSYSAVGCSHDYHYIDVWETDTGECIQKIEDAEVGSLLSALVFDFGPII